MGLKLTSGLPFNIFGGIFADAHEPPKPLYRAMPDRNQTSVLQLLYLVTLLTATLFWEDHLGQNIVKGHPHNR